jgi:double zinc ribbon protein
MSPLLAADDSLFGDVNDFFDSGTWLLVRNLTLFFVVVFWAATAYWVYKDARRRIEDPWMIAMAVVLGIVPPFLGPIIYMFFRPPEYLEEVRERELEIKAMEERLARRDLHCPVCRAEVEASYLVCPVCTTKLKQACVSCKAPLEPLWQVCPYCETPIVRRSSVFDQSMGLSPETLEEPLRMPRRGAGGRDEDTAENLSADK